MTQALDRIARQFLTTGYLTCELLPVLTGSDLYRQPGFTQFSVECQLSENTDDGSRRSQFRHREIELLTGTQRGHVLDLMCGVGNYVEAVGNAGHRFESYLGIDISPAAVDHATRRFAACGAEFRCADVLALGAFTGPFDTVMLNYEALNALAPADAGTLLDRVAGELAPRGEILIDIALLTSTEPPPGRTANVADDSSVTAIASRVTEMSETQLIIEHEVHFLTEEQCGLHFAYRRWEPSAELLTTMAAEAGLRIRSRHQIHRHSSTAKSSIRRAHQFVLTA